MTELEKLRAEEGWLETEIEHNKRLLHDGKPCCDIAALAVRLSDIKKSIGALTVGKLITV